MAELTEIPTQQTLNGHRDYVVRQAFVPCTEDWKAVLNVLDEQYNDLKAARKALWYVHERRFQLAKQVINLNNELDKYKLEREHWTNVLTGTFRKLFK